MRDADPVHFAEGTPVEDPAVKEWTRRVVFIPEKQIILGLRWLTDEIYPFPLHIPIALPFLSIDIGCGRRRPYCSGVGEGSGL